MAVTRTQIQLASGDDEGRIQSTNVTASNEEEPLAGTGTLTILEENSSIS